LRDPDRNLDQALRHLVELPALVDEARHRVNHVADERERHGERGQRQRAAHTPRQVVGHQADAHQLAAAEGMAQGEEGAGGAQPGDDVVGAAQEKAELTHARLREHDGGDGSEADSSERAARCVEAVEEPPQRLLALVRF
jgi:hypothetical protein